MYKNGRGKLPESPSKKGRNQAWRIIFNMENISVLKL